MKNKISQIKTKQRKKFISLRENLNTDVNLNFNLEVIDQLFKKKLFSNIKIISSFFSIQNEIPTRKLNNYLMNKNKILTFPVVNLSDEILEFREYQKNQKLILGKFNIPEPPLQNKLLKPELLFVPCLAFDTKGYRLGYGGGYYDKTFAHFKSINHKFISIGFAYDAQKTELLTIDKFDYKLNFVLTEKQLYSF